VFPFGSEPFVRLRERLWLDVIGEAADAGRSLIFTFAPEATVDPSFPDRVRAKVESRGGEVLFVRLDVDRDDQRRRIGRADRHAFGKLRSLRLLEHLSEDFAHCLAAMPAAALTLDTSSLTPAAAATRIAAMVSGR